jgi:type II secretory pathway component PulC
LLTRTLDAGLGAWLGQVDVEPKVIRGRFQGWLIHAVHASDPCWADVDLRAGDVVSRVNHRSIERPEQAQAVWSALRRAREISVDFVRAGRSRTLTFAILEDDIPPRR